MSYLVLYSPQAIVVSIQHIYIVGLFKIQEKSFFCVIAWSRVKDGVSTDLTDQFDKINMNAYDVPYRTLAFRV